LQKKNGMHKIEYFPLVTEDGEVIGKATRKECHSGSFLLHPVVHLHVFNPAGELFLQKRNMNKDIQPGKWDTSVGGHVDFGEKISEALFREVREELAIIDFEPKFLTRYKFVSEYEAELVNVFFTVYDGEIQTDTSEISEGRFWTIEEIKNQIGNEIFTPNLEQEFQNIVLRIKEFDFEI
jgi:isopentenyldiphosphate isomerase